MSKLYNIQGAGEKYTNREGNEKTSWNPIGKLLVKDDGKMSILLFLTGQWYSCFEPKEWDTPVDAPSPGSESPVGSGRKY